MPNSINLYPNGKYSKDAEKQITNIRKKDQNLNGEVIKIPTKSDTKSDPNLKQNESNVPGYNRSSVEISPKSVPNKKDISEWNSAKKINTINSYVDYLNNNKSGYYVKDAQEAINDINISYFKYTAFGGLSEDMTWVKLNGKFGFIDRAGREVIPCIYDDAYKFTEGFAVVKLNNKFGFIDKLGKQVIPIIYDYASSFNRGIAKVSSNGKYYSINKSGTCVLDCK
jgi:hypothetical protein